MVLISKGRKATCNELPARVSFLPRSSIRLTSSAAAAAAESRIFAVVGWPAASYIRSTAVPSAPGLSDESTMFWGTISRNPHRLDNVAGVRRRRADHQRMVELPPFAINARRAPIAGMRNEGVVKGQFFVQFETGVGARDIPAAVAAVADNPRAPQQGEHHRAVGDIIARQAAVQQRQAAPAVAIVDPILRRQLDPVGPPEGAEGNLVDALAPANRRGKQCAIADERLVVDQLRADVDPPQARVQADGGSEAALLAERMRDLELREDGPAADRARRAGLFAAEDGLTRPGRRMPLFHREELRAVERPIEFPQIAAILLVRDDVAGTAKGFPMVGLDQQAGDGAAGRVEFNPVVFILDRRFIRRLGGRRGRRPQGQQPIDGVPHCGNIAGDEGDSWRGGGRPPPSARC